MQRFSNSVGQIVVAASAAVTTEVMVANHKGSAHQCDHFQISLFFPFGSGRHAVQAPGLFAGLAATLPFELFAGLLRQVLDSMNAF
mmetsp:Transcript_103491/g.333465  ORF Transcript_103491/g.333465 Transcript_103491/m.333465 type:complete len:86 (+) Transcript_103491:1837-2094(+)